MLLANPIRTHPEMVIQARLTASVTSAVEVTAIYAEGREREARTRKVAQIAHSAGDRTTETFDIPVPGRWLWDVSLHPRGGPKRGQLYGVINLGLYGFFIGQGRGYLTAERGPSFGVNDGMLSGRGFLEWEQLADDIAGNVNSTLPLAATNARRLIKEIRLLYHSSSDVATRTMTLRIRDRGTSTKPTGWSISDTSWLSPTLTLTQDEEGAMHVGKDGFLSVNDAGVVTTADNTTAPHPFPLWVEEGDPVDLLVSIGSGEAADDYDVWALVEEWLEP